MDIRRATIDDLDRLVPLFDAYRVFYAQPSDPAGARTFLHDRIAHNESVVFLAGDVGFAQLYPGFSSIALAPAWLLNDLYVDPAARARGVGRALVQVSAEHARRSGATCLTLETAPDNAPARSLYASLGFRMNTEFLHYVLDLHGSGEKPLRQRDLSR